MALAFDAVSSTSGNASSFTWSHTTSGSDRLLVAQIGMKSGAAISPVTGVTYNGVALTMARRDFAAFNTVMETWYLVAPATGANNVVVSMSVAAKMAIGAISLTGVDQVTPTLATAGFTTASGTAGPQSVTITTTGTNSWLTEFCEINDPQQPSVNNGQTSRWNVNTTGNPASGNSGGRGATRSAPTAGNYSSSWNWTGANHYGIQAVEIKEAVVSTSLPTKNFITGAIRKLFTAGIIGKEID